MPLDSAAFDAPGDALGRPHSNCYWLLPGRVLAGEYPGAPDPAARDSRLAALLDAGVRCVVDLTGPDDGLPAYAPTLYELALLRGARVRIERFPIADYSTPAPATMRCILAAIVDALQASEAVYLHCHGGIGRTGTVAGCLMVECGVAPERALALIEHKWLAMEKRHRAPQSPETDEQRDFILRWPHRAVP